MTKEFFELAKSRQNDQGVLIVNIGSTFDGDGAVMFRSVAKTMAKVFDDQCVFATLPGEPLEQQNVFIVAASHDLDVPSLLSSSREANTPPSRMMGGYLNPSQYDTTAGVVFTDDYNPVEYLVAGTL